MVVLGFQDPKTTWNAYKTRENVTTPQLASLHGLGLIKQGKKRQKDKWYLFRAPARTLYKIGGPGLKRGRGPGSLVFFGLYGVKKRGNTTSQVPPTIPRIFPKVGQWGMFIESEGQSQKIGRWQIILGPAFGRTDFSRIFIFEPPDFFADFLAGFFLLIFVR